MAILISFVGRCSVRKQKLGKESDNYMLLLFFTNNDSIRVFRYKVYFVYYYFFLLYSVNIFLRHCGSLQKLPKCFRFGIQFICWNDIMWFSNQWRWHISKHVKMQCWRLFLPVPLWMLLRYFSRGMFFELQCFFCCVYIKKHRAM